MLFIVSALVGCSNDTSAVEVFDAAGRRVSSMRVRDRAAGVYQFAFDGHDDPGLSLASGVYFCRVSADTDS